MGERENKNKILNSIRQLESNILLAIKFHLRTYDTAEILIKHSYLKNYNGTSYQMQKETTKLNHGQKRKYNKRNYM